MPTQTLDLSHLRPVRVLRNIGTAPIEIEYFDHDQVRMIPIEGIRGFVLRQTPDGEYQFQVSVDSEKYNGPPGMERPAPVGSPKV